MNSISTRHRRLLALAAIACLGLGMSRAFFEPDLSRWGDNAEFIVLAKSLASGHKLRDINHPDRPIHNKYPAGFPALLAPFEMIAPDSVVAMKSLIGACYVLSALLIFWLFGRWDGFGVALTLAVLFICSHLSILFSYAVMSELPFMVSSLGALLALSAAEEREGRQRTMLFAIGLAAALFSMLTRTVGIALVAAIVVHLGLHKRWRALLVTAAAAAIVLLLHSLWRADGGSDYTQAYLLVDYYDVEKGYLDVAGLLQRVTSNFQKYVFNLLPWSLVPSKLAVLRYGLLVIAAVGWVHQLKQKNIGALYFGATIAALLIYPRFWAVPRFTLPLLPFSLFFCLDGLRLLVRPLASRLKTRPWMPAAALVGFGLTLATPNLVRAFQASLVEDRGLVRYFEALSWIRKHTPKEAVVLCRKPFLGYIKSKRKTLKVPRSSKPKIFFETLDRHRVRYVIVDKLGLRGTREVLRRNIRDAPTQFRLVHRTGSPITYVFQYRASEHAP